MRRGLIFSLSSNVVFFLSGYVLHFFLGHAMPAASYGIVGTIITVLDFEYMFLSNGARQSLAKEISMSRYEIRDVIVKTIVFQCVVIAFFFVVNFFGAPVFGHILNDSSLAEYFRIAAFLVPANGLFVILLGINDGLQHFGMSALLGTFYPLAKLLVIPLVIFVFYNQPVIGVEIGFLLSLILSILIGLCMLIPVWHKIAGHGGEKIPFSYIAKHTLSFSLFFIVASLVLSVDTLIVKSVVEPPQLVGYYTGAVNFGKIPYYLMSAFVTVVLPVIAKMVAEGEFKQAVHRSREVVLIALVFILPISVIISASSRALLGSFYGPSFETASQALGCLALSNFFMGMTVMLNMILNSHDSTRFSDVLSVVSLIVVIPVFVISARTFGITGIALASMGCTFALMLISLIKVRGAIAELMTTRAWVAIGCTVLLWAAVRGVFSMVTVDNLVLLGVIYAVVYVAFVGLLVLCRVVSVPVLRRKM